MAGTQRWITAVLLIVAAAPASARSVEIDAIEGAAAYGISRNGEWVVGEIEVEPFRWNLETGVERLGVLSFPIDPYYARAQAVTDDGSLVVGTQKGPWPRPVWNEEVGDWASMPATASLGFTWSPEGGLVSDGNERALASSYNSTSNDVSATAVRVGSREGYNIFGGEHPKVAYFGKCAVPGGPGLCPCQWPPDQCPYTKGCVICPADEAFAVSANGIYWVGASRETVQTRDGSPSLAVAQYWAAAGAPTESVLAYTGFSEAELLAAGTPRPERVAFLAERKARMDGQFHFETRLLGDFEDGNTESEATDVSDRGDVVVGWGVRGDQESMWVSAFRWTSAGGLQPIEDRSRFSETRAASVSANGRIVAGAAVDQNGSKVAWIWTKRIGLVTLRTLITDYYGAEQKIAGWSLEEVAALSADGATLAVRGHDVNGPSSLRIRLSPRPDNRFLHSKPTVFQRVLQLLFP